MKKQHKFITEYTVNGKKYGSSVFATSWKEAEEILKQKRNTEKILGYDPNKFFVD